MRSYLHGDYHLDTLTIILSLEAVAATLAILVKMVFYLFSLA